MIKKVLYLLSFALKYVKSQPQIVFALLLIVIIPLLFLYSGQQFLGAAKLNLDIAQRDRIGMLHDALLAVGRASGDVALLHEELKNLTALNADIQNFKVAVFVDGEIEILAALDESSVGTVENNSAHYQTAVVSPQSSVIFTDIYDDARYWHAYRSTIGADGNTYFIYTAHSLADIDYTFAVNERSAYITLGIVYLIILFISYWLIRNTDYRHLYTESKKANETKDLFTNMIAHELRAPLTAIRGYASMVEESASSGDEQKKHASRIKLSSERLLNIVNDLLEVARIQSGKLSVIKEEIDLAVIINAVVDEQRVSAQKKSIALSTSGTDISSIASGDQKRLHQVFTNLLSNSIKYTKEGGIELEVIPKASDYEVRIKDTGMGISAAEQKQLFAPFYRVESNDVSTITGTGLGMWITRQLVELMRANIAVESIKGVGTHVVVTIPKS